MAGVFTPRKKGARLSRLRRRKVWLVIDEEATRIEEKGTCRKMSLPVQHSAREGAGRLWKMSQAAWGGVAGNGCLAIGLCNLLCIHETTSSTPPSWRLSMKGVKRSAVF
jgi:hypothetical protein